MPGSWSNTNELRRFDAETDNEFRSQPVARIHTTITMLMITP
jgi:hypothetical protein